MAFMLHLQVYIAAFAISGYASATFRNRYKPFNPVLGETFEYTRDNFRFISEQVRRNMAVTPVLKCIVADMIQCAKLRRQEILDRCSPGFSQ